MFVSRILFCCVKWTLSFALAERALSEKRRLSELATSLMTDETLSYDAVYDGKSDWKLLPPIDCPGNPHRVHVSGTGLTHLGSARDRQAMHVAATAQEQAQMTDSMRMFEWGRQQGRPSEGEIGIAPEWFYKGDGSILQAAFRAAAHSRLCRRRRRRSRDRGHLHDRGRRNSVAHRHGGRKRILRSRFRTPQLSQPRRFKAAHVQHRPRIGD